MEKLNLELSYHGTNLDTDPRFRLTTRPQASQALKLNQNAFGDMGTTLQDPPKRRTKYSSQTKMAKQKRPALKSRDHDQVSSDDQLDSFSETPSSPAKAETSKMRFVDDQGTAHEYMPQFHPDKAKTLSSLRFTKNKAKPDDSTATYAGSSRSSEIFAKENEYDGGGRGPMRGQKDANNAPTLVPSRRSDPRTLRDRNPRPKSPEPLSPPPPKGSRPRPRPVHKSRPRNDVGKEPQPFPLDTSGNDPSPVMVKPRKNKLIRNPSSTQIRVKRPKIPYDSSSSSQEDDTTGSSQSDSPVQRRPRDFPLLSPPSSQTPRNPRAIDKPKGNPFPLSPPRPGPRRVQDSVIAQYGKKPTSKPRPLIKDFPMLSPQSSERRELSTKAKGKQKAKSLFTDDENDSTLATPRPRGEPFPLNSQFFNNAGSPSSPVARLREPLKRYPLNSGDDSTPRKKKKESERIQSLQYDDQYEEEDSLFISPNTDPKTLCPYCDAPLPPSPSPLLTRLLQSVEKKSSRDPRPTNPLGRKAPFTTFIAVCQRHRFESQILPQAEQNGWPKTIDWKKLTTRIQRMKPALQDIVDDKCDDTDEMSDDGSCSRGAGARSQSLFWCEVMKAVKKKGSRAAAGVKDQFLNFEKTQPGYYGELGSIIIHQTLYDFFPPSSLDVDLIAPLGADEFLQRVLLPEVALRLIMEDRKLKGAEGKLEALQILRDSSAYGVAMFPADGGEGGAVDPGRRRKHGDAITAAESIVMERARKRRLEIEEEEEKEEEERLRRGEETAASSEADMNTSDFDGRQARSCDEGSVCTSSQPSRPRPRPVVKGSSKASVLNPANEDKVERDDTDRPDTDASPFESTSDDSDDTAIGSILGQTRKPRSPSVSEIQSGEQKPSSVVDSSRERSRRSAKGQGFYSGMESDCQSAGSTSRRPPRPTSKRNPRRGGGATSSMDVDSEQSSNSGSVVVLSPAKKSVAHSNRNQDQSVEIVEDASKTPRPPSRQTSANECKPSRALKPLERARLQSRKGSWQASTSSAGKKNGAVTPQKSPTWIRSMRSNYGAERNDDSMDEDDARSSRSSKPPILKTKQPSFSWLLEDGTPSPI